MRATEITRKDHPRVGGEKPFTPQRPFMLWGSPTRGRGKGWPPPPLGLSPRITHAWAGKSLSACRMGRASGDHPRVGGEKPFTAYLRAWWGGSPTRGRGKDSVMHGGQRVHGITHAWAGKRFVTVTFSLFLWDHPRVGGEKPFDNPKIDNCEGSPTRGRGKVPHRGETIKGGGITPA